MSQSGTKYEDELKQNFIYNVFDKKIKLNNHIKYLKILISRTLVE